MQAGSVDAETLHLVTALVRSSNTYELGHFMKRPGVFISQLSLTQ